MGVILLVCLLVHQCATRDDDGPESTAEQRPDVDSVARERNDSAPRTGARPAALTTPIDSSAAGPAMTLAATMPVHLNANQSTVDAPGPAAETASPVPANSPPPAVREQLDDPVAAGVASTPVVELDTTAVDSAARPAPYEDYYLTDDSADMGFGFKAPRGARAGRRFVEAELIYYESDDDFLGSETEKGLRTRWRQETLNWGDIDAQFIFSDIESDFLGRQYSNDEVYFTLRQTNAPLDNGWLMNNTAGHQRTLADPFLHTGYRIRLPTSLFVGVSMGVTTDLSTAQWYMGKTGDNLGIAVPQFRENGGEILGGSWRQSLADSFMLGAEVVDVKGQDFVRDHTSLLAAGSFVQPDGSGQYDLHLLTDDDTNLGLWADSRNVLWSSLVLRYGAFYLDPELAWMDRPIVSDQYGAYLRADKRTFVYNYSVGYDYTKAGLGSNSLFDADHQSLYANGNYRLTRKLSIGLNGNLVLREFSSTTDDSQVAWRVSNFVNYRFQTGLGRFELYASQLDSDFVSNNNDLVGARVSYDWNMPQGYRLTTEAMLEEQRRLNFDNSNQRLSVLFRQSIASNLSWGVNTTYYRNDDELLNTATGIGINADARWQFLRDWYVSASLARNQSFIDSAAANLIGGQTELQSDSVWLRFGYANTSGQAHQRFGRSTSSAGGGRIQGQVFFDENRDFIRQPGERPAVGVVVLIDGRYETRTDGQGRYEFDPVYPGPHRVSLLTEDLPLPWGLDDDVPQGVDVSVRQTSELDFALVDLQGL